VPARSSPRPGSSAARWLGISATARRGLAAAGLSVSPRLQRDRLSTDAVQVYTDALCGGVPSGERNGELLPDASSSEFAQRVQGNQRFPGDAPRDGHGRGRRAPTAAADGARVRARAASQQQRRQYRRELSHPRPVRRSPALASRWRHSSASGVSASPRSRRPISCQSGGSMPCARSHERAESGAIREGDSRA
jgi:hypothetical protein